MGFTNGQRIFPALSEDGAALAYLFGSMLSRQLFFLSLCCGRWKEDRTQWTPARCPVLPQNFCIDCRHVVIPPWRPNLGAV